MKYKLVLILFAFLLASCGKTDEKKEGTHAHEDATVHTDCCDEHEKPQQESFEVEADSSATETDAPHHIHYEGDGHNHDHDHDHEHNSNTIHKH
jgi:PBP1b-binding outer membrane lipoprotein LpoB